MNIRLPTNDKLNEQTELGKIHGKTMTFESI
jgi:hypothetical protein